MSNDNPDMKVLKTGTCKSTSGKSTLTYQIGALSDSTVHIRITNNSGNGFVNTVWISTGDIQQALAKGQKDKPLTSFLLHPLFEGRSSNSASFYMSALTHERLLRVLKGKKRGHEFLDPEGFNSKMDRLASAKSKPKGTVRKTAGGTTKKTVTKKAAIKKKAMSRQKTVKTG